MSFFPYSTQDGLSNDTTHNSLQRLDRLAKIDWTNKTHLSIKFLPPLGRNNDQNWWKNCVRFEVCSRCTVMQIKVCPSMTYYTTATNTLYISIAVFSALVSTEVFVLVFEKVNIFSISVWGRHLWTDSGRCSSQSVPWRVWTDGILCHSVDIR